MSCEPTPNHRNPSYSGEGNHHRNTSRVNVSDSDMVTGVPTVQPNSRVHREYYQYPDDISIPEDREETSSQARVSTQMDTILHSLENTARLMSSASAHPSRILQSQVPIFRGSPDKFNEFEHLLLNYLKPYEASMTEPAKLQFFQSLLRDSAIEFWQSLNITPEATVHSVLQSFRREYRKEESIEAARIKWDALKYDPTTQTFSDFLLQLRKLAKHAFGEDASTFVNKRVYGKLPATMQHELSLTGRAHAPLDEIKEYINRRCQLQTAIPHTAVTLVNEVSQPSQQPQKTPQANRDREVPRFNGNCNYCGIKGHKKAECRKRMKDEKMRNDRSDNRDRSYERRRDSSRDDNRYTERRDTRNERRETYPKDTRPYNSKLVCQICGYTGHSAVNCYQRTKGASAYRNLPYARQDKDENTEFRRDFKRSQRSYPANEMTDNTEEQYYSDETPELDSEEQKNM